ncbi:MAG: serine protease [bacterium]|nr:serine protease [bacterium]
MDIEHLSKSQVILLTLLISFVTSIATGIVTVSLMEQAPPSISQSVNRIVERTVEKVVPTGQAAASVVTRETTVVVKESELIAKAVENASPSVVRVYSSSSDVPLFLGFGVVLDSAGTIASDYDILGENADAVITSFDGTRVRAFVTLRDINSGIAFFRTSTTSADGKPLAWKSASIAKQDPVLGQTVVGLSGKSIFRIAGGIVTALIPPDSANSPRADVIDTSIPDDAILPGSILINTDGEVIGMSTGISRMVSAGGFVSSSALAKNSIEKKPTQ